MLCVSHETCKELLVGKKRKKIPVKSTLPSYVIINCIFCWMILLINFNLKITAVNHTHTHTHTQSFIQIDEGVSNGKLIFCPKELPKITS